ncbi:hypothetical protein NQ315_007698 [Exocentrus adspersus]|uniref:Uncharacterized protein n=1 Tax=Exocentrus adspersus TaxID=1586481 RepID=A0AAV8W7W8_9CUCU|nr:hypothetical protein NQ315_007698 [Exocentrus adspersus]
MESLKIIRYRSVQYGTVHFAKWKAALLQRVIYIFFYLFGKQNGACNLLHGEVILKGLNRKQTEFIAVPNIYCVVLVMDIQQYITESKVRRRT